MVVRQGPIRDIPLRWIACWLLLPHLIVVLMWPVIGVPMQAGLAISCVLALFVSQLPWRAARVIGVVSIVLFVTIAYVCNLFAIPPLNFGLVSRFFLDVNPLRSPEYVLTSMLLLLILIASIRFAPRVPRFNRPIQFLYAALSIVVFINLDGALALDSRHFSRSLPSDRSSVDSAVRQVGLSPAAQPDRHVLLIVVEALGAPAMPEEQALFAAAWDRPEWRRRYEVRHGTNLYFGSTTNGELRELCGRWVHYTDFDFDSADCLPQRFRKAGYETTAVHSFVGTLFDRLSWYPQIGFERTVFAGDLYRQGARECPGVFPGACDADVPALIGQRLAEADRPQFLYWLTLNTHLPVLADPALGTERCSVGPAEWREESPALCRLFQLHDILADRISRMATSPGLPATDILIVGDHKPPVFARDMNRRFDPGRVPWIYLRAKD